MEDIEVKNHLIIDFSHLTLNLSKYRRQILFHAELFNLETGNDEGIIEFENWK